MKKVQLLTSFFSFNIGTFIQLWAAPFHLNGKRGPLTIG